MTKIAVHNPNGLPTVRHGELEDFQGDLYDYSGVEELTRSIIRHGIFLPKFAWKQGKKTYILDGHKTKRALETLEERGYEVPEIPVAYIPAKTKKEAAEKLLIISSKYGKVSNPDAFLEQYQITDDDLLEMSSVMFEAPVDFDAVLNPEPERRKLSDIFVVPPFTLLDTRRGYWMERKKAWHELILDRGETREKSLSKAENLMSGINGGASILDPVLAELANRWFCPPGGKTFDCFAGDSVFGFVSNHLGHAFTGIELRQEQADLNNERIAGGESVYICADGQDVGLHVPEASQDMLFSCPPYFDLEVYSKLPNDASNQGDYGDFLTILQNAFTRAIACLKDNRFAVIVVGDLRDARGNYRGLPGDIKAIFEGAGMPLYNELIIVEPLGTLPQRVGRYMRNRKVGKCHQNVLVFYKGNTEEISEHFPEIDIELEPDGSQNV